MNANVIQKKLRKGPQVSTDAADRAAVFCLTSTRTDRDGEQVVPSGGDLTDFRAAGSPVLWAHDTEEYPVGHLGEVWLGEINGEEALLGRVHFSDHGDGPKAWGLCEESGLACSISFIPTAAPGRNKDGGARYSKWSLIELSLTPTPCNPDATLQRHLKSLYNLAKDRTRKGKRCWLRGTTAWLLKSEGGLDQETEEYLEERGFDSVRVADEEPDPSEWTEVELSCKPNDEQDRAYMKRVVAELDEDDLEKILAKMERREGQMSALEAALYRATGKRF